MTNKSTIPILAMDHLFDPVFDTLPNQFKIIYPDDLKNHHQLVRGILTTPWSKVDYNLINDLPNLEIISCFGTGVDSVDIATASRKKIIITNTPDIVTEDTANLAITLLLSLSRRIVFNDKYVRAGKWQCGPAPLGHSIFGKTLGMVGLGRIGKNIAEKALTFGLNIVYHSRTKKDVPFHFYENLIEMANVCDYLIVCCPGGQETQNIIDLSILKALGKNGYLINVARGSTVNEKDLIVALENNIIAGAGLDVYLHEPNVPETLLKMDQVILLPHIGTATKETREKMLMLSINNIKSFFTSGNPITPIIGL